MKILITLLLALFISSQAYAQSHAEVLEKGRILQEYEEKYGFALYVVAYNNWVYTCTIALDRSDGTAVRCYKAIGSNEEVE
jgi:hypothetical protein